MGTDGRNGAAWSLEIVDVEGAPECYNMSSDLGAFESDARREPETFAWRKRRDQYLRRQ